MTNLEEEKYLFQQ